MLSVLALVFVSLLLALTSGFYGVKFLKQGNYLLGPEWLVVTFSATNAAIFIGTGLPVPGVISHFCDAFSRGFGMPVIAVAGLMAVTNGYKASIRVDLGLFAASFLGALFLVTASSISKVLPYFYVVMWTLYSVFLAYFTVKLWKAGEKGHAVGTIGTILSSQFVASFYDFFTFPGDAPGAPMHFYLLAEPVWAFTTIQLYYAYRALERAADEVRKPSYQPALSARAL